MRPMSLDKERFDGLKRCVEIDGRQYIPKADNSTKTRVVSEVFLRRKIFQMQQYLHIYNIHVNTIYMEYFNINSSNHMD